MSARWTKMRSDLKATKGRMIMMVLAIAVSIFGIGTILSSYSILTREINLNYMTTNPATALIEMNEVPDGLIGTVKQQPGIIDAEASSTLTARVLVHDEWVPMLLFVVRDFQNMRMNTVQPESGAWPPAEDSILIERVAMDLLKSRVGDKIGIQTPNGSLQEIRISGTVHDQGLAPAWQEQMAYGYISPATLVKLGESGSMHILKVETENRSAPVTEIEETISGLAGWLHEQGHEVHEIRIPPPDKHPHQSQMTAILVMMLIFSLMALVLSSILTAAMIGGLLAQQVRQIGVMKAIGGTSRQIMSMYLALVVFIGTVSAALGLLPGIAAGRILAREVGVMLNFTLYSESIPWWVYVIQLLAAILVPLIAASIPIMRISRMTVREAISDFGTSRNSFGSRRLDHFLSKIRGLDRTLILALRNSFRRRGRLILTLGLLAAAGGMFMTSLNIKTAWEKNLADAAQNRQYDLELRLNKAVEENRIKQLINEIEGVKQVENWSLVPAGLQRQDGLEILRTYPDGGHGSFSARSAPAKSQMLQLPMMEGRWLQKGDTGGVVLNHMAQSFYPTAQVGDMIKMTIDSNPARLQVIGISKEIGSPATAYVMPESYEEAIGQTGTANAVRVTMNDRSPESVSQAAAKIRNKLEQAGISIKMEISEAKLNEAIGGHVYILIFALIMMSLILGIVGALGLMSTMATNVVERTREFGIMRTIGGKSSTVMRNIISEGIFIGILSWGIAIIVSLPLSASVGSLIGKLAFRAPLPLMISPFVVLIWLAVIIVGASVASAYPAWKASRLTVRETLSHI
ncbi:ABC transporter permease [Paenibacillus lutrae]|uniref:FtsX-like permease family protein n=1 Tax=Paenibacillus lutrae TaxID=2078573 RepID=A0A7X3JXV8_9BACL|nr:FtsX-like permease family protein [Paenibacillus lutrae]MVO98284.1 FtsX-like permease family protein [Paenibacillus lutrae]